MNAQTTENSPRIKKETKNKIRVDFERTSFWTRFRLKFLTGNAVGKAIWWLFKTRPAPRYLLRHTPAVLFEDRFLVHEPRRLR